MRVLSVFMMTTWMIERLKSKSRNEDFLNIYGDIEDRVSKVNGIVNGTINVSSKRNIEMNVYRSETINSPYSKKVKE